MIASPNDLLKERQVVRDVIHEWNSAHAENKEIVLMPVGWESHTVPEMGERPQGIINRQLLEGCDLLVGVFWTRIGTPTGKAESGTVEEIEEHLDRNRPAMLYFSSVPVHPDSVDTEQYEELKKFKRQCRERGLVEEFDSTSEFREKFSRQIAKLVIKDFSNISVDESDYSGFPTVSQVALSNEAKQLILAARVDKEGMIWNLNRGSESFVKTNERVFTQDSDPRTIACWRGAVNELHKLGLIEDRTGKGTVFYVTGKGYEVTDKIAPE